MYYPPLFLGIIGAGGRFTGSNPAYTAGELAHHLRISQSDLLITQARCLEVALQAAEEVGLSQDRIFLFDDVPDNTSSRFPSWKTLLQYGEADWIAFDDLHTAKTTTAVLASTRYAYVRELVHAQLRLISYSGTTGLPKMAARSHHSFVVEHHAMIQEERKPYKVSPQLTLGLLQVLKEFITGHAPPLRPLLPRLRRPARPHLRDPGRRTNNHPPTVRQVRLPALTARIPRHGDRRRAAATAGIPVVLTGRAADAQVIEAGMVCWRTVGPGYTESCVSAV